MYRMYLCATLHGYLSIYLLIHCCTKPGLVCALEVNLALDIQNLY